MSTDTQELLAVAERLPADKRVEVIDFARFLLERERPDEEDGDAAWERIIADPRPRPKLEAFVRDALAEGSEPLDPETL